MVGRKPPRAAVVLVTTCAFGLGCVNSTQTHVEPMTPRLIRKHDQPLGGEPSPTARLRPEDGQVSLRVSWASPCAHHTLVEHPRKEVRERSVSTAGIVIPASLLLSGVLLVTAPPRERSRSSDDHEADLSGTFATAFGAMVITAGVIVGGVALLRTGTSEEPLPAELKAQKEPGLCPYAPVANQAIVVRVGEKAYPLVTDAEGKARVPQGTEKAKWAVEIDGAAIQDLHWE